MSLNCNNDKPMRPLSAYNLFFKHEREIILQEANKDAFSSGSGTGIRSQKLGFAGLAKCVSFRWSKIDPVTKKYFDQLAAVDRARYFREMNEWKSARMSLYKHYNDGNDDDDPIEDKSIFGERAVASLQETPEGGVSRAEKPMKNAIPVTFDPSEMGRTDTKPQNQEVKKMSPVPGLSEILFARVEEKPRSTLTRQPQPVFERLLSKLDDECIDFLLSTFL